ncbi:hypothetical protein AB0H88_07170 [Nonomuraea sp. NPDC050680]|uniref:hypothetical protein n=1 Tax=Nonomuraea sp. NPDC050680 TaxID=3154630 RepID=UPI0033F4705E
MLEIRTGYLSSGTIDVAVRGWIEPGVRVALRIPEWSHGTDPADDDGCLRVGPGAGFRLDLDLSPQLTRAARPIAPHRSPSRSPRCIAMRVWMPATTP